MHDGFSMCAAAEFYTCRLLNLYTKNVIDWVAMNICSHEMKLFAPGCVFFSPAVFDMNIIP